MHKAAPPEQSAAAESALQREVALLREICARNKRELSALINDGSERRMSHAASKLGAAVEGMEKATVKILKSSEVIDVPRRWR